MVLKNPDVFYSSYQEATVVGLVDSDITLCLTVLGDSIIEGFHFSCTVAGDYVVFIRHLDGTPLASGQVAGGTDATDYYLTQISIFFQDGLELAPNGLLELSAQGGFQIFIVQDNLGDAPAEVNLSVSYKNRDRLYVAGP